MRAVIAKSFARIHAANLINFGIIPMVFDKESDYETVNQGDVLEIKNYKEQLNKGVFYVANKTMGTAFKVKAALNDRQKKILLAGSLLALAGTKK